MIRFAKWLPTEDCTHMNLTIICQLSNLTFYVDQDAINAGIPADVLACDVREQWYIMDERGAEL